LKQLEGKGLVLPAHLVELAYPLDDLGNLAWRYNDARNVLGYLKNMSKAIIGGEAYTLSKDRIDWTWEFWEYEADPSLSVEENAACGYETAVVYLDSFHRKFGDDYCFSIIFM
jgi:hypothetical protein